MLFFTFSSFEVSKTILKDFYKDTEISFYCPCSMNLAKNIQGECLSVDIYLKRRNFIEWDHILPMFLYKDFFSEWTLGNDQCKQKGRHCVRKTSSYFNEIEADLYNIVPTQGSFNAFKGNLLFSEGKAHGLKRYFCSFCNIFKQNKKIILEDGPIRGFVARAILYMNDAYIPVLSEELKVLYLSWDEKYPPEEHECKRHFFIQKIQAIQNNYLNQKCSVE